MRRLDGTDWEPKGTDNKEITSVAQISRRGGTPCCHGIVETVGWDGLGAKWDRYKRDNSCRSNLQMSTPCCHGMEECETVGRDSYRS